MKRTYWAGIGFVILVGCGGKTLVEGGCGSPAQCASSAPTAPIAPAGKPGTTIPSTVGGKCNLDKDCPTGQNCFGSQCITIGELMPFPNSASTETNNDAASAAAR